MSVLLLMFIIPACSSYLSEVQRVELDHNISYVLQPIPEELVNTGIQALFNVKQRGKSNQFLMQVEMTESSLLISGMTVEGLSLFTLNWNADIGTLQFDKKIAIEPMRVLAEIQLVLWPVLDVSNGLKGAEINLMNADDRDISVMGRVIYQIRYQDDFSYLINVDKDYEIQIEELDRWKTNS